MQCQKEPGTRDLQNMAFLLALWRMAEKWDSLQQRSVSHILIIVLSVTLQPVLLINM